MFDSPVLDVAIGLTFIYLLYSLLATTVKELIATIFTYRGRMLERGIEQMLDGVNYSYYWWNKLFNFIVILFKKEPAEGSKLHKKSMLFTAQVTKHPIYVRSSENSLFSKKPAYLAADTFSDILLDLLVPSAGQPVLLKNIAASIKNKAADPNDSLNADAAKILNIYVAQANGDLQRFKLLIENWYNDTMDRVSGWYKRQAYAILFLIGFILAMSFNVSTIDIVHKLSTDKAARAALVQSASDYVKKNPVKIQPLKAVTAQQKVTTDTTALTAKPAASGGKTIQKSKDEKGANTNDHVAGAADTGDRKPANFSDVKAGLDSINTLYNQSIAQQNTTLGLGWNKFGFNEDSLKWIKELTVWNKTHKSDSVKWAENNSLYLKDSLIYFKDTSKAAKSYLKDYARYLKYEKATFKYPVGKPSQKNPIEDAVYIIEKTIIPKNLIGFLITALAISLGAPFWFDLLNKFINLRVSGAKPDDNSAASKTPALNQKPLPNSFA